MIFVALGLAIALCGFAGVLLAREVSAPLRNITEAMGELATGNLETQVPHADQADEIGQLAEAMTAFPCFANCGKPACQTLGCIRVYNDRYPESWPAVVPPPAARKWSCP